MIAPRGVAERERSFWEEHVPSLQECLGEFERGPDRNTQVLLDVLEPIAGKRILDIGCGGGVTAAFLAARGAVVTGVDLSPASIHRAREVADHLDLPIQFVVGDIARSIFEPDSFDLVAGRYVLHHLELEAAPRAIREVLAPGGRAAFLETVASSRILSFCRRWLSGRVGIARYGSIDERPLTHADLELLSSSLGEAQRVVGELRFWRIFDRNVLRYRWPRVSRIVNALDDLLLVMGLDRMSYHQVLSFPGVMSSDRNPEVAL